MSHIKTSLALYAVLICALIVLQSPAQVAPINGMRPADLRAHAITGATVIPAPGQRIENAVIVIRQGVIVAVGAADQVQVPAGARIWQAQGMTIYPGLIEPALLIRPNDVPKSAGAHWNARVRPQINMSEQPPPDKALRKELRGLGFTTAAVYPSAGVLRGSGNIIALADEDEHALAYLNRAMMAAAFEYGGRWESASYPGSLMGAIALLRQTLLDAQWHAQCRQIWRENPQGNEPPLRADALEALEDVIARRQRVLFEVSDESNALRAARVADEFQLSLALLGSGTEFRRLHEIASLDIPLIVPLEFPKRSDVSTVAAADSVSLRDLMTWEQAPTNVRRLLRAGARVSLTTHRLKSRNSFHPNLRDAIKHGLTEDQALAALTIAPANLLGLEGVMGTIAPGKVANLVVVKGSLFEKEGKIYETWVNGRRYEVTTDPTVEMKGSGLLVIQGGTGVSPVQQTELKIELDTRKSTVTLQRGEEKKISAKKVIVQQDHLSFVVEGKALGMDGYVRLSAVMARQAGLSPPAGSSGGVLTGTGELPDGTTFDFTATITPQEPMLAKKDESASTAPQLGDEASRDGGNGNDGKTSDDPVTGTWTLRVEEMPSEPVALVARLNEDGTIGGHFLMMGQHLEFDAATFEQQTKRITLTLTGPMGEPVEIDATVEGENITGTATSPSMVAKFSGAREPAGGNGEAGAVAQKPKSVDAPFIPPPEQLNQPLGEYGLNAPPTQQSVLITNATIWTCGPQGVIENGWLLVRDGKIAEIGAGGPPPQIESVGFDGVSIDAASKHLTPGLIDCHSHTGIDGGVNEWTQANTAEVRIGDCVDPDDINWYRQLAGGLTACNQLHGSANPIGGHNSVVKLKWGHPASAYRVPGAIEGIKFALGENVKRSQGRYPNTRMGVETFIFDAFTAAREYKGKWDRYHALASEVAMRTFPPQRDLELEALLEILQGERIIHCHSYRQDEILMLIRIADHFGFTIGTFQHVLEGYKVAEAIAKHGAGGSSFSDWWAYKMEVMDAIPHNGALMTNVGVLMSFNSDSNEMARRMNTEAAKAVRYGGLSPEDALKLVTINPAKQLRIHDRVGSLEVGKDADFAIWSGDPLSTYTRCEQTWIEGAKHFDLDLDQQMREQVRSERQRIIQKILAQAHGSAGKEPAADERKDAGSDEQRSPQRPGRGRPGSARPESEMPLLARMMMERHAWLEDQLRSGRDPSDLRPGDCGCGDIYMFITQSAAGGAQ